MGLRSGNFEEGSVTASKLATHLPGDTTPGAIVLFEILTIQAAGDNDVVLGTGVKVKVLDAWFQKTHAASGGAMTVLVGKAAAAITDAMAGALADQGILRAATIDDANTGLIAGDTLRVTTTDAGIDDCRGICYVECINLA